MQDDHVIFLQALMKDCGRKNTAEWPGKFVYSTINLLLIKPKKNPVEEE